MADIFSYSFDTTAKNQTDNGNTADPDAARAPSPLRLAAVEHDSKRAAPARNALPRNTVAPG
jgi:hypothetical protein